MPRLKPLTERDDVPEDAREAFDAIIESRGSINGPQSMNMYSPQVALRASLLNDALRRDGALSDASVELAICVAAREFDIAFVWGAHAPAAERAGVGVRALEVVRDGLDDGALSGDEAVIVRYGRELLREHRMADATFEAARLAFGERGVIELGVLMGYYLMIGCTLIATDVDLRVDMPQLPPR